MRYMKPDKYYRVFYLNYKNCCKPQWWYVFAECNRAFPPQNRTNSCNLPIINSQVAVGLNYDNDDYAQHTRPIMNIHYISNNAHF